jgi:hypothetical protein
MACLPGRRKLLRGWQLMRRRRLQQLLLPPAGAGSRCRGRLLPAYPAQRSLRGLQRLGRARCGHTRRQRSMRGPVRVGSRREAEAGCGALRTARGA